MGSLSSKPKPSQVAPIRSGAERRGSQGDGCLSHTVLHWTSDPLEEPWGSMGRLAPIKLPPLKQKVSMPFSPLTAESFPDSHRDKAGLSIIQSHPPKRPQVLQPMARPTDRNAGDCKSTARRGGCGPHSSSHTMGGILEAQLVLGRQAHSQRQAHRQKVQELHRKRCQKRASRLVVTANESALDSSSSHHVQLVKRAAERDIFWDVSSGESITFEDLLEAKSPTESPPLMMRDLRKGGTEEDTPKKPPLWMLEWEKDKHTPSIVSRMTGLSRPEQREHQTFATGDEGDVGLCNLEGRRLRGHLGRTRTEIIPFFENKLNFNIRD